MPDPARAGVVLDTGALLAIESGKLNDVLAQAYASNLPIRISGGAVAQAWRGGPRSARLAALLKQDVQVVALDLAEGRRVGELIARTIGGRRRGRPDVVDAHAALLGRETKSLVYTSDPDDIVRYGMAAERIRRV
jgi:hypothetical protein